ncbi:uncharacterized protein LOC118761243 [Octopus sinensis]|uniref:Endoplasmic reticulum lectin 1 n=1 Tax=Octopus sinensis TaxID=2607531 RepID=A0A7E6EI04_9MOLL|nr:uncharacterized protein LOC118761243 [Octopus sinensis]
MNFMGYVNDTILEDEDLNVTVQDVKFLESLSTRYYSVHAYVAVNYTDGDICLSTNVPRHVMVYYVCFDQFEPSIISISEVSTCVYQIAIGLQTLCSYERKVRNSQQRNIISCYQDELPKNDNLKIPAPNEMTVSELTELIETSLNLTIFVNTFPKNGPIMIWINLHIYSCWKIKQVVIFGDQLDVFFSIQKKCSATKMRLCRIR